MTAGPFAEVAPIGLGTAETVAPRADGRDARGRTLPGHPGPALKHGRTSLLVKSGEATGTEQAVARQRLDLREELGGQASVGIVKGSLADTFVELDAIRAYLGQHLETDGPLTNKGKTRALLTAYLSIVDRQTRLGQLLGLESRRSRPSLADYLDSLPADAEPDAGERTSEPARERPPIDRVPAAADVGEGAPRED